MSDTACLKEFSGLLRKSNEADRHLVLLLACVEVLDRRLDVFMGRRKRSNGPVVLFTAAPPDAVAANPLAAVTPLAVVPRNTVLAAPPATA